MLVSHRHEFIYTKTLKTGGTSVESYFERFCVPDNQWSLCHERDEYVSDFGIIGFRGYKRPETCQYWNHMPAALIREKVGEDVWEKYFKFCVIRNPYEKVVSAFYFLQRPENSPAEIADLNHERARFEDWLLHSDGLPLDRDKYLIEDKFCLDTVIRYETLARDMKRVCDRLKVPWIPSSLPRFKVGVRPGNATVHSLYTKKSRQIVETAFAFELEYFQYSFPKRPSRLRRMLSAAIRRLRGS